MTSWKAGIGYNDLLAAPLPHRCLKADRLRKLFDDAGQGNTTSWPLIDHYQRNSMEADERIRAVRKAARRKRVRLPVRPPPGRA